MTMETDMSFIALPSSKDGTPLHRRTYGSAITETFEEAEEWAKNYIKRRKERLYQIRLAPGGNSGGTQNRRKHKRAAASFARLDRVIIYEDVGSVPVSVVTAD